MVLRQVDYKETDKILTILTPEHGKITATARACRKKNSPLSAGCGTLILSQFMLYHYKDRWTVNEANLEREFKNVYQDLPRFSLACYFSEVCELLALDGVSQDSILSLFLNCLHVLDKQRDIPLSLVKAVFEFRVACESGYTPMLDGCSFCHKTDPSNLQFSILHGSIHCKQCGRKEFSLSPASLSALRFLVTASPKEIFSFTHSNPQVLSECTQQYLHTQLEHSFSSLSFYHQCSKTM